MSVILSFFLPLISFSPDGGLPSSTAPARFFWDLPDKSHGDTALWTA